MAKAYKVTISGSYKNSELDHISFTEIEGIIPFCDEDVAKMHIKSRYAPMWISQNPDKYKERLKYIGQVFVDSLEVINTDKPFSFVGKDIKKMNFEELQDLATCKDLRRIPLYNKVGLRQAQILAYVAYDNEILEGKLDHRKSGFDFAKLPALKSDGEYRTDTTKKLTNDEVLSQEQEDVGQDTGPKLTRADLEAIAKGRSIAYHPNISDDNLYKKIYA